ncbi:MAG: cupin [Elusimicrobia bacterium RIFOXYA2_FULL_39_19]|nr:MAG: cupin [Elusimicrobia bacterium RIFOXYA2_FULL_39_19]
MKKDFTGKVFDTEKLVQYQKNSIVSQTLINKKEGTVTLFAFDKGQGLSEHTASFDAMLYLLDGTAGITIEKKSFTLKKGQMIILPANKPHSVSAVKKFKMALIMIKESKI